MFSAEPAIVTINIFLLNHTVCNQPWIGINETNLPWFSFKETAGAPSLGRISFIHHLYPRCVFSVLEDPENLLVSLLHCSCSLHQTLHPSGVFLLNPPCEGNIFPRGRPNLLNPVDSGGHICFMGPLEWIILASAGTCQMGSTASSSWSSQTVWRQWRDAEPELTAGHVENEVFQEKRKQGYFNRWFCFRNL